MATIERKIYKMGKDNYHVFRILLFPLLFLLFLAGCQIRENESSSIQPQTLLASLTSTKIRTSELVYPTVTATRKSDSTKTNTPRSLPEPGKYIAYASYKTINLISISGGDTQTLIKGASGGRNWLSPNQRIIGYSEEPHILHFRDIYTGELFSIADQETCRIGNSNISWNPEGDKIIIMCFDDNNHYDLVIMTFPEGKITGKIRKIIDLNEDAMNIPYGQIWSPNGQWIAFFINTANFTIGDRGPYITDTSCLVDYITCASATTLSINDPWALITWTPESNLAMLDEDNDLINIYSLPTFTLNQSIKIQNDFGDIRSFAWSQDSEWFALGTETGIFIISDKTKEVIKISEETGPVLFWIEIM